MGARAALIEAADAIRGALSAFVKKEESRNIRYFESSPGHLRFVVGSDKFKGRGPADRQNLIWKYLRENVGGQQLAFCYGVHTMDVAEFKEAVFTESSTDSMHLLIDGSIPAGEDADE